MAGTISSLNVKLVAGIGSFNSTMTSAIRKVSEFSSAAAATTFKVGGIVGAVTSLVAGGSLIALVHSCSEAADANGKLSDRLFASTEGLVGLQHAANLSGVSSEQLTGALEKQLKLLGGVADDGENVSNIFTKLGLNAAELANMPTDESFAAIADRLAEIKNPAERAAAATQIYGKAAQALLPMLAGGKAGLQAAREEAEKLGLTYSRIDAAKIEESNDAWTKAGSIVTGIGNQLTIAISPYLTAIANKLVEVATAGGGIGPKVGGAVEWVASAVATAADYVNLLPAAFHGFRAGALTAIASVLEAVDYLGGGVVKLLNLLPGVSIEWTDSFSTLAQGLNAVAAEEAAKVNESMAAFHRGDASAKVAAVFEGIRNSAQKSAEGVAESAKQMTGAFKGLEDGAANVKKVQDTLDSLDKEVRQFGMSSSQKKLDDIAGIATPEQLAKAKASLDQIDALTEAKKRSDDMTAKAKQVVASVATPQDKFNEQMTSLNQLLDEGYLGWSDYSKAVAKAQEEMNKAATTPNVEAPDLFKSGSAQAARLTYDIARGTQKANPADVSKSQLAEAKSQSGLLDRIERNTRSTDEVVEI